ncbi:MAG: hypothetical protein ACK4V6_15795, partial [Microthrixaceae bacterium]
MPLPDRVRLIVLFGGRSAEHDVSRVSASHVMRAVDPSRYEVVPVGITRDGEWRLAAAAAELMSGGHHAELPGSIDIDGPTAAPLPMLSSAGADTNPATNPATGSRTDVAAPTDLPTVVLPVLHGPNGEDGTVQGLLEVAGVPYVGSGVLGAAVAMDKAMAKTVLAAEGIAQPGWRQV